MMDFTLIDLESQAKAFVRYTRGWTVENIIIWLAQRGTVFRLPSRYNDELYRFRSVVGIETSFRFTEEGRLIIFQEHALYMPDPLESE